MVEVSVVVKERFRNYKGNVIFTVIGRLLNYASSWTCIQTTTSQNGTLSGSYYSPKGNILAKDGKVVAKIYGGTYTAMNGGLPNDLAAVFEKAGLKPQFRI